jgi:hypothetical protein
MTYERFSQLWDEIIGNKCLTMNATDDTVKALIEYGQGNKSKINAIREFISKQDAI